MVQSLLISVGKKTCDFMKWVSEIIKVETDAVLKIKEFTIVNDCFQYKSNEEIGVFWHALITVVYINSSLKQFPSKNR